MDALGLDEVDTKVLLTIIEKYEGGPVGSRRLRLHFGGVRYHWMCTSVSDADRILQRTPRGEVTRHAYSPPGRRAPRGRRSRGCGSDSFRVYH